MVLPIKTDAKLSVTVGEKSTDKLMDAVIDTFSPATEFLGYLGDVVRLARVSVATEITRRAKVIADESGLRLTAPPLKFLAPFYEKASVEDQHDETLMEMWARLLASAGGSYDPRQMRYTSILAEMSPVQARILQALAVRNDETIEERGQFIGRVDRLLPVWMAFAIEDCDSENWRDVCNGVGKAFDKPGLAVAVVKYLREWEDDSGKRQRGGVTVPPSLYNTSLRVDFEILRSMGLLDFEASPWVEYGNKGDKVCALFYRTTDVAYDFWRACCDSLAVTAVRWPLEIDPAVKLGDSRQPAN